MQYQKKIIGYSIFLMVIVVVIFYTMLHMFNTAKRTITSQFQNQQKVLVNQSVLSIKSYFEERIRALEVLADFPASQKGEIKIFLTEYERTFYKVGGFESILFVNAKGEVIAGFPKEKVGHSNIFTDKIYYGFLLDEFQIVKETKKSLCSDVHFDLDNKKEVFLLTPVYNKEKFLGIILGKLVLEKLVPLQVEPILTGFPGYIWMLKEDGTLVYHSYHNKETGANIFKPLTECFKCHTNFEIEKEFFLQTSGSARSESRKDGQLLSFATLNIPSITLRVVISTPEKKIQSAIDLAGKNFLLLGAFVLFLSIASTAVFIFEINKRKQVERNLEIQKEKEALENRYYDLVENIPDGVFIYKNGMFSLVNSSMCKIFEYDKDTFQNTYCNWEKIIISEHENRISEIINQLEIGNIQNATLEIKGVTKSNKILDLLIILYSVEVDKKKAIQGILRDVTELKRLEAEKKQKENLALMGEMGARIAHEIKNPLASIQTGIQLLKSKFIGKKTEEDFCDRIIKEINRMDNTIKSILHFAKSYEPSFKNITILSPLNEVLRMNDQILKEKNIVVHLQSSSEINLNIDEAMWKQIFWNLLNNSVQAIGQNGNIFISVNIGNEKVIIEFGDDATPIPNEIKAKIFDPFFSTKVQGTGLGLAITKRFIEMHKGIIYVPNNDNQKVKFVIELPITGERND